MPLNEQKIIRIILEEAASIEERCAGYREVLVEVLSEIMAAERQNLVQGTNIQQRVTDQCNKAGGFLAERRYQAPMTGDEV